MPQLRAAKPAALADRSCHGAVAGAQIFSYMPKDARSDECLIPFARLGAMVCFDYKAPTELFASRKRLPRRQLLGYKRFAQAADAIRFAMEEVPRECLACAFLEVDGERYGGEDIRRLYESAEYPLARRAAHS
jgi:hypothetical protein